MNTTVYFPTRTAARNFARISDNLAANGKKTPEKDNPWGVRVKAADPAEIWKLIDKAPETADVEGAPRKPNSDKAPSGYSQARSYFLANFARMSDLRNVQIRRELVDNVTYPADDGDPKEVDKRRMNTARGWVQRLHNEFEDTEFDF